LQETHISANGITTRATETWFLLPFPRSRAQDACRSSKLTARLSRRMAAGVVLCFSDANHTLPSPSQESRNLQGEHWHNSVASVVDRHQRRGFFVCTSGIPGSRWRTLLSLQLIGCQRAGLVSGLNGDDCMWCDAASAFLHSDGKRSPACSGVYSTCSGWYLQPVVNSSGHIASTFQSAIP